jgi:hypothetical protein
MSKPPTNAPAAAVSVAEVAVVVTTSEDTISSAALAASGINAIAPPAKAPNFNNFFIYSSLNYLLNNIITL